MNLTVNGYKITLGPRALAHVETMKSPYFEDAAKVYAQNELERWCAGGKVGPDVTITGPERFVPRGNEIGIPMKAGVAPASVAESKTGSKEPLPVASAAPADLYEPVGTVPVVGDRIEKIRINGGSLPVGVPMAVLEVDARFAIVNLPGAGAELRDFDDYWRVLKRPATKAHGVQVWRIVIEAAKKAGVL